MTALALTLVFGIAAVLSIAIAAQVRFRRRVSAEVAQVLTEATAYVGPDQLAARRAALPEPVHRYLAFAISVGAPAIRSARLKHGGVFRTSPKQPWQEIAGEEYFTVANPGFVWSASIHPAPLLSIVARDLLQSGRGNMLVKLNSLITIADASGPEMNQGANLRWLAEAIWFPYAFVAHHMRWDAIDDRSARATLITPEVSVSAIFEFDHDGKITGLNANRYRDLGKGRSVLTRWTAEISDYREFSGFRVPTAVDVAWEIEGQRFSYARFQVTTLEYNCTDRFPRI
jgi:hypothetical protein